MNCLFSRRFLRITVVFLAFLLCACAAGESHDTVDIQEASIVDSTLLKEQQLRQKVGQMLLVGFRGMEVDSTSKIVRAIKEQHLGGIILFERDVLTGKAERNIASQQQLATLCTQLQNASDVPLFIAIDQEGGLVNRLKSKYGFPESISAQEIGNKDNIDSTYHYGSITANTLQLLGINLNFAPVVDVNVNPANPVIGKIERSFSSDPDKVATHAIATIDAHHHSNVLTAIKHFPGHGSAWNDSHHGMADVTETWTTSELIPFQTIIDSGRCDMVMTAHIFNAHIDSVVPATLSSNAINGLLRDSLGFQGVVVSDDMQMKAITSFYGLEEAITMSLNSGVDILLFGNNIDYDDDIAAKAIDIIVKLVKEEVIKEERIDQSYQRIMQLKERLK